jgi:DNA mismatch endonuclease (patch repair protein)
MADMFSPQQRSEIMSKVKGRGNQATELRLINIFRKYKIKGWRRRAAIFGNPDFVFRSARLAVFVDGCFWHQCPYHGSIPNTNRNFWVRKLNRNKKRDQIVNQTLKKCGWHVLRIWQHELRKPDKVSLRVMRSLRRSSMTVGGRGGRKQKSRSG